MAQYDIPILQEDSAGKFVRTTLAPGATAAVLGTVNTTRVPQAVPASYAALHVLANAVATAISTISTWTKVTVFSTASVSQGASASVANNEITVAETGNYFVTFTASVTAAGASKTYEFEVRKTAGVSIPQVHAELRPGVTDVQHVSAAGIVSLTAADVLALYVQNTTDDADITFRNVSLTVTRLP